MGPTSRPRVKICCIASVAEAMLAIRYGASAVGLVSAMPSGPGVISEALIKTIAGLIPPGVSSFLLTSNRDAASIIDQQRRLGVSALQLVDAVQFDVYGELRVALPGITIVQVIHVRNRESVEEALAVEAHVSALLLDSGNPSLPTKELGGTGRTHDWTISRKIREAVNIPVYLAGGLTPDNVSRAIDEVAPFGLDVCRGVRTEGALDERKLSLFIDKVNERRSIVET
jgi:phosphoribosylanthranilate isomerase